MTAARQYLPVVNECPDRCRQCFCTAGQALRNSLQQALIKDWTDSNFLLCVDGIALFLQAIRVYIHSMATLAGVASDKE
ncbi:hypothetical protein [Sphingobium sp. LMC3-1-1.1]|jgi:hypothetical protein|uniref:hypothetical protein n=1 Tax=unclassified Sphingobium TaxID=2611147 RepID=UPI003440BDBE